MTELTRQGEQGAFIKLATRSPKDTIMESERVAEILTQEMKSVSNGDRNGGKRTVQILSLKSIIEMVAFVNSLIKAMNLSRGEEILQIFQASERVSVDLERYECTKQCYNLV